MDYPESIWDFLKNLFSSNDFMPHGHCYLWRPEIVWLHAVSDALIALSYYSIPLALIYFVRRRQDLAFRWMFVMFGIFIMACGTTHVMNVVTLWLSGPQARTACLGISLRRLRWGSRNCPVFCARTHSEGPLPISGS